MKLPKNRFDCVVVGAGPAGSSFAYRAARAGLEVLLLDKRKSIGEPVRCGEGLGILGFINSEVPIHPSYCTNIIDGFRLVSPGGNEVCYSGPKSNGYIVDRFLFDKAIAVKAAEAGASLFANCEVLGVERKDGEVSLKVDAFGKKETVQAPLVIGADGRESNVGKWLGIDTRLKLSEVAKGFQYDMIAPIKHPGKLQLFLGNKVAPKGYLWIFPKGPNRANIGVGIDGNDPFTAKYYVDKFLKEHKIKGQVIQHVAGTVPLKACKYPPHTDNALLVGDAARFVNPIHGGGIQEAIDSGIKAAETAVIAFKKNDFSDKSLQHYSHLLDETRKKIRILKIYNEILTSVSDEEFDYLFKKVDPDMVHDFSAGKCKRNAIKLLMGKPSLLRYIRKLR